MKKMNFYLIWYGVLILIGIALIATPALGWLDDFWVGMGGGLIGVAAVRLVQVARYKTNDAYAERVNVSNRDERNKFLAEKARSYAYFYGILIECVGVILLRIFEYPELSTLLGMVLCLQLLLYWGNWLWLRKRY